MFHEHQPKIGAFARQSPDNMAEVYTFVLATVQQSLWQTPTIMQSIAAEGIESHYLWGFKGTAYEHLQENKERIYNEATAILTGYADPAVQADELLAYFSLLPGLGLVKGGFMVQLCFGASGCVDTHNLNLYGVDPKQFKASSYKAAKRGKRRRLLREYHILIDAEGGTAAFWDRWCEYVAKRSPARYRDAYEVSEMHLTALGLT